MGLTEAKDCGDDDKMIPIDMGEADYEDFADMIEKIGAKKTVEAFIEARERLVKANESLPEEDRAEEMTVAEWKQALEDQEGEEEELFMEGEEEELLSGDDEGEEEEGTEEPAAKKAKTD